MPKLEKPNPHSKGRVDTLADPVVVGGKKVVTAPLASRISPVELPLPTPSFPAKQRVERRGKQAIALLYDFDEKSPHQPLDPTPQST